MYSRGCTPWRRHARMIESITAVRWPASGCPITQRGSAQMARRWRGWSAAGPRSLAHDPLDVIMQGCHADPMVPREVIAAAPRLIELGVAKLGVFGSVVRGEAREGSDLDVLVEFSPGRKTFDSFCETAEVLEQAVGRRVDLVTTEALSPHLAKHILREVEYVDLGR